MALIIEDGTGKADAESFISLVEADALLLRYGYTIWAANASEEEREAALRRSTRYMEQSFRSRWKGSRESQAQALSWPRVDVMADGFPVPSGEVPREVAEACALLALRAAAGELNADITGSNVKREKVDVLEVEYDTTRSASVFFRSIEMTLSPLLRGAASPNFVSAQVVRT